jgi:DNA polymerase III epsilon subunit-like protein
MRLNNILVLDLETSSADPATAQILEIAALVVDPDRLAVLPESRFQLLVRPEDESAVEADALAKNNLKLDDLRKAPPVKVAFAKFAEYVGRFNAGKTKTEYNAPHPAGYNITRFDLPILDRYCARFGMVDKEGEPKLYNRRVTFDMWEDAVRLFGQTNRLPGLGLDDLRRLFGIPTDGAHRAMKDVEDVAWVTVKMLRLYRSFADRIPFANAYANENGGG